MILFKIRLLVCFLNTCILLCQEYFPHNSQPSNIYGGQTSVTEDRYGNHPGMPNLNEV